MGAKVDEKKGLRCFNSNFETYTRYSWVANEEQKESLKCFKCSFLSSLVGGSNSFFNFFKGAILKKSLGNPALNSYYSEGFILNWLIVQHVFF